MRQNLLNRYKTHQEKDLRWGLKVERLFGVMMVAISATAFGFMPIFARFAYTSGTNPLTVLFFRFFIAALIMLGIMLYKGLSFPRGKTLWGLILMGGLGYVGQSFSYFTALTYASASLVALLLYLYPALVTILAALVLKEKVTRLQIIALFVALVGTALIIGFEISGQLIGIILGVLAALIYSVYIIAGSRIIPKGSVIPATTVIMMSAAAVFGIINLFNGLQYPRTIEGMIYILLIAVVGTAIALVTFFIGVEKIGPTSASTISTLEPVVTIIAAVIFLHEKMYSYNFIGGFLILTAIVLLTRLDQTN